MVVITFAIDSGDGVGVDRSQAMHTFFKGLGGVCLGALTGAGLGAALFFAAEMVLPKQVDAAPAHTVAKTFSSMSLSSVPGSPSLRRTAT